MSSTTTVNGTSPSSASLSHLTSYPVINDSIKTFKSNPYGQKSLSFADQIYATFAKPIVPYLSGPYQYVSPYVHKADSIADSGLSKVEQTFPIVKSSTGEIKNNVTDVALFPLRKALESKEYVFSTYGSEYKKIGGDSYVTTGKALVSTGLVVTSDSLTWLSSYLGARKEDAKNLANQAGHKGQQKKDQAKQTLNEKTNH